MRFAFALLFLCSQLSAGDLDVHLGMQLGHVGWVSSAAFSTDGRVIATGGSDGFIRLWDASNGREVRAFQASSSSVSSMMYLDSMHLIAQGEDGLKIWDLTSYQSKLLQNSLCHQTAGFSLSQDSSLVLACASDESLHVYDIATGREIAKVDTGLQEVSAIALSPDGRRALFAARDSSVQIWDTTAGAIRELLKPDSPVSSLAFSSDGNAVLLVLESSVRILDLATGTLQRRFETIRGSGRDGWFSADRRWLVIGDITGPSAIYEVDTGKKLKDLEGFSPTNAVFSRDGTRMAFTTIEDVVSVFDAATWTRLMVLKGESSWVTSLAFSPSGRYLLAGSEDAVYSHGTGDDAAHLWDLYAGQEVHRLKGFREAVNSVAFSPDEKYMLTGDRNAIVRLWDVASGQPVRDIRKHKESDPAEVTSVSFSPDGTKAIIAGWDGVEVRSVTTGELLDFLEGHDNIVNSAAISRDGRYIVSGDSSTGRIWNVETGEELHVLSGHKWYVKAVAIAPDSRRVLTASWDKTVRIWDRQSGTSLGEIDAGAWVDAAVFSPDGKYIATGDTDGLARVWDAETLQPLYTFDQHQAGVHAVAFSPDSRFLASGSEDGTIKIWDLQTNPPRLLATLVAFRNGAWAVAAPSGRFEASNLDGGVGLHWIVGDEPNRAIPIDLLMQDYYTPRLLPKLLANYPLPEIPDVGRLNRVQPVVEITHVKWETDQHDSVAVDVVVTIGKGTLFRNGSQSTLESGGQDLRVFRNGQLIAWHDGPLEFRNGVAVYRFEHIPIPRSTRKNFELSAYAFNSDRLKSATVLKSYKAPDLGVRKGTAWVLVMGVNRSSRPVWNLRFAANDAHSMGQTIRARLDPTLPGNSRSPFGQLVLRPLISDDATPEGATKERLHETLAEVRGKAQPEDMVLLFFSGHGYTDTDGQFYILPSNVAGPNEQRATPELRGSAISSSELRSWLRPIDAGSMTLIVDACHSAASVEGGDFIPGPMSSQTLGQLAYDKRMRVLAASQADDIALESDTLHQGLLTYALLRDGIDRRRGDWQPADGRITVAEWLRYAVQRVPELYLGIAAGTIRGVRPAAQGFEPLSGKLSVLLSKNAPRHQPALFDFANSGDDTVLVDAPPRRAGR